MKSKTIAIFYTEFPIMLRVWKVNHKRRLYGDFSPPKRTRLRQSLPDIHEKVDENEGTCALGCDEHDEIDEENEVTNSFDENDEHDNFDE